MTGKTNPVSGTVLERFRGSAAAAFSQTWVTLFSTNPITDGDATTYGTGYVEWAATNGRIRVFTDMVTDPYWTAPSVDENRMKIENSTTVGWSLLIGLPAAGETVVGVGVFDSQTGGNLLYWDELDNSRLVMLGDTFQFSALSLIVRED
jgi:hypothetical protein